MADASVVRLNQTVDEIKKLHEQLLDISSWFDRIIPDQEPLSSQPSMDYWVSVIYRNSIIKLRLLVENNFLFLETIGVLGLTRYVFEILVWLKTIKKDRRYALVFYSSVFEMQIRHNQDHKNKMTEEINFFEYLEMRERELSSKAFEKINILENTGRRSATDILAAVNSSADEVDRQARRRFCIYANQAKTNGYGFQAHLLKTKGYAEINSVISELIKERDIFLKSCPRDVQNLIKAKWNWKQRAVDVGMLEAYEYIYGYTSRLLHATPVSIVTNQKNLEADEMLSFIEYVYVSFLDALELAEATLQSAAGRIN